ncbi:unnamed protein product [Diatraea saccharalis]|uniref:PAS domain-containing protein n=1 Tax=Diatraea saccharalis TaxID=40085 RepID=A0A9P0CEJ5_9NEOP|nr:unnamed protein product [Diatraea saccharalis]
MDINFIRLCSPDITRDKENIDINRDAAETPDCTPAKLRLGKFGDVYSPEHLNLTPKNKQKLAFDLRNEGSGLYTPEKYTAIPNDYKCRTVKAEPHFRHGLGNCSFEGNQSFPRLNRRVRPIKMELETPTKVKPPTDFVRVDGPNGLRFNTSIAGCDRAGSPAQSQTERLQQTINPSKAVFTIEPNTLKILIVNNKACSLLGYSSSELCDLRLSDLLHQRSSRAFNFNEAEDVDSSEDRPVVLLSGKVVELLTKEGSSVQVSLWIRQLDSEGPCLVVAEPVNCRKVKMIVEAESGAVVWCGGEGGEGGAGGHAAVLFQAESAEQLRGVPLPRLVPSVRLRAAARAAQAHAVYKQKATGRTLDGASFPLCLWISKADCSEDSTLTSAKYKDKLLLEVNIRVTYNVSGLLVVDEAGVVTACNHHFAMLTFGKPHAHVVGQPLLRLLPAFCRPADRLPRARRPARRARRAATPSPGSDTDDDSCGAFNGSQKSACLSLNVNPSFLSATREKSSSALCLDKSDGLVTHTPTPTQDMVSSISTTERRHDLSALPDLTSGMSGISIDDDNYCPSLSKSRSENILRSERTDPPRTKPSERSDSIYYTSQHSQEVTPTGAAPRVRIDDPSPRLSFDSSKFRSSRGPLPGAAAGRDDRSSLSLDLCDSNETSADFLTPINEMPPPGCELEDLPAAPGNRALDPAHDHDLDARPESTPRKKDGDEPDTPCVAKRLLRSQVNTSTPRPRRDCDCDCDCDTDCARDCRDCPQHDGTYRGTLLHEDGTELNVIYTVSTMVLSTGARVRCVWLGVQLEDTMRHTTLASSQASTGDDSLAPVSTLHYTTLCATPPSPPARPPPGTTPWHRSVHYTTLHYAPHHPRLQPGLHRGRLPGTGQYTTLHYTMRHTTLASSQASTGDDSLAPVSTLHYTTLCATPPSPPARPPPGTTPWHRSVHYTTLHYTMRHTTLASSQASTGDDSLAPVSTLHYTTLCATPPSPPARPPPGTTPWHRSVHYTTLHYAPHHPRLQPGLHRGRLPGTGQYTTLHYAPHHARLQPGLHRGRLPGTGQQQVCQQPAALHVAGEPVRRRAGGRRVQQALRHAQANRQGRVRLREDGVPALGPAAGGGQVHPEGEGGRPVLGGRPRRPPRAARAQPAAHAAPSQHC